FLRQGFLEPGERLKGAADPRRGCFAHSRGESRMPRSGGRNEMDVAYLRSTDQTFLRYRARAKRCFLDPSATLRRGPRVLWFRLFSERRCRAVLRGFARARSRDGKG